MKKRTIFFLLVSFLFFSCHKSELEKKVEKKLSVWYIFTYDSTTNNFRNLNYAYIFKSNGKCDYVYYDFSENKLSSYLGAMSYDIKVYNIWEYNEKTKKISIMCSDYYITKFEKDTIYLKYPESGKYDVLVNLGLKNPKTLQSLNLSKELKTTNN
jgi:hypothetical protein